MKQRRAGVLCRPGALSRIVVLIPSARMCRSIHGKNGHSTSKLNTAGSRDNGETFSREQHFFEHVRETPDSFWGQRPASQSRDQPSESTAYCDRQALSGNFVVSFLQQRLRVASTTQTRMKDNEINF